MTIENLAIKNFRGVEDITLNFNEKSVVLFGGNGVGKSTVLDVIQLIFARNFIYSQGISWGLESVPLTIERIHDFIAIGKKSFEISMKVVFNSCDYNLVLGQSNDYNNNGYDDTFIKTWNSFSQSERYIPILAHYQTYRNVSDIVNVNSAASFENGKISALCHAFDPNIAFTDFFKWFRERNELENDRKAHKDAGYVDEQLKAVKNAVLGMLSEFSDLCMRFFPLRLVAIKQDRELRIDQLSDGEKSVLSMFADIARRLAIANPFDSNPLFGEGIILIDEVDAHLHPSWQAKIMPSLMKVFPNIQFIVTTHSPKVLSEYKGAVIELVKGVRHIVGTSNKNSE